MSTLRAKPLPSKVYRVLALLAYVKKTSSDRQNFTILLRKTTVGGLTPHPWDAILCYVDAP